MSSLRVLISGGGIGGPALAFWLAKLGHDVTIIERSADLRVQGQQIDIRGQGIQVIRRMGIEDLIRAKVVDEAGMIFVDNKGRPQATFVANRTGVGRQSLTSEFEIMRGDLVRIIFQQAKDLGVRYIFDASIESFEQDPQSVTVRLSNGTTDTFDLLVGADGQGSRTRRLMLGPDAEDPFYPLGLHMAFFTVPRLKTDTNHAIVCISPRKRVTLTRNDNPETTQAYLAICPPDEETRKLLEDAEKSRDIAHQKRLWSELFRDAGWQADRFVDALREGGVSEDFYCVRIGQIRMEKCYRNRVALIGDAGYAPGVQTGHGTTCALIGAYVLAGEISNHCPSSQDRVTVGVPDALEAFGTKIAALMKTVQHISIRPSWIYPNSQWGVTVLNCILWLLTALRIDRILQSLQSDDIKGWDLPDYPGLSPSRAAENPSTGR